MRASLVLTCIWLSATLVAADTNAGAPSGAPRHGGVADFLGALFFLSPLILVLVGVTVYMVWRSRSPEVGCPRCRWRGRLSEAARTGQGGDLVPHGFDHVAHGAWLVGAGVQFLSGDKVCPRCGSGPLIRSEELPPPRPPRRRRAPGAPSDYPKRNSE